MSQKHLCKISVKYNAYNLLRHETNKTLIQCVYMRCCDVIDAVVITRRHVGGTLGVNEK